VHDVDAASAADATSFITSLCGSAIMYELHQLTTAILSSSAHFPWQPAGSFVIDIVKSIARSKLKVRKDMVMRRVQLHLDVHFHSDLLVR
jgi:hypothetical protein